MRVCLFIHVRFLLLFDVQQEENAKREEMAEFQRAGELALLAIQADKEVRQASQSAIRTGFNPSDHLSAEDAICACIISCWYFLNVLRFMHTRVFPRLCFCVSEF